MSQKLPTTLQKSIRYFAEAQRCFDFVVALRWPHGPVCPRCQSQEYRFLKTRSIWECKGCKKQYSMKVGTIFEDSAIKLDKWLCAIWMIVNAKHGVSSYEIARSLGVTQKTAWFMMHRIRLALQKGSISVMVHCMTTPKTQFEMFKAAASLILSISKSSLPKPKKKSR